MTLRYIICPWCHAEMQIQHRHGVEIDLCPNCHGVWLDRGELDQIIQRSDDKPRSAAQPSQTSKKQSFCTVSPVFKDQFEWF